MNFKIFLTALFCCISHALFSSEGLHRLRVDGKQVPQGLHNTEPKFSWQIESDAFNVMQMAYRVIVSKDSVFSKNAIVWDSNKVPSSHTDVQYKGDSLVSNQTYYWKVMVWTTEAAIAPLEGQSNWTTGLFGHEQWKAKWITQQKEDNIARKIPYFRHVFDIRKKVKDARLYITSKGMYEPYLNGTRIGNDYFTPGWTVYDKRIQYQVYDIKELVNDSNVLSVTVGHGWFRSDLVWKEANDHYGHQLALKAQVMLTYEDGTTDIIPTGPDWEYGFGPIIDSEIYHGEIYDANRERDDWYGPSGRPEGLKKVLLDTTDNIPLVGTENNPVRKQERFQPKIIKTSDGKQVLDFGQNLVGWIECKLKGNKGDTVKIKHAEILDKNGRFYTENLRAAKQTNTYILNGSQDKIYHPHFTFQGFRYALVEGLEEINVNDFEAVALYSDMEQTGYFETSNPLVNQLQHNIVWGQKGNFIDVPTDCPQRDERLGWTGDAQVFFNTASYNMDVKSFFEKWLKDLALEQRADGAVPYIVPNLLDENAFASAGWADAATIIPWNHYVTYGDKDILSTQYPSMKKWVDYIRNRAQDHLWKDGFHFGDWLFYRPDDDNDGMAAVTNKYLIAQCFYARSVEILAKSAEILGYREDAIAYGELLEEVKEAFQKEYLTNNGMLVSDTQTAYVLALQFEMLPEDKISVTMDRLVANIEKYDMHLTTGFLGTPYLNPVLSRYGRTDIAIKLLLQDTYPSWLYPVKMGATTIWERWDGIKPDGSTQTPNMNSYNHYAYGAIGEWMYSTILGLKANEDHPGYTNFTVKPLFSDEFTRAKGSYMSPQGNIVVDWKRESNGLQMELKVPVNSKAELVLPYIQNHRYIINGKEATPKTGQKDETDLVFLELGSGTYNIESQKL
ncbi:family 78 glycoside hydrolase catalytic domain [Muricauda sp. ANG21]|uniref:alpha-L-rhamnosidase n=1 Tax=Allomuricauda sp. ANG21 TaxID=3042468 RepID=UPI003455E73D